MPDARRLSREQRDLIRARVDEFSRKAQKPGRAPTGLHQATVEGVAVFLASEPERLFSKSEIGRALDHNPERIRRALAVLQKQGRVTAVRVGHYPRWKAVPTGSD